MVFTAPPSFSLPTTEKTVRRAQLLKKKKPPSLLSNDPFQRAPPYEAVWSARQDTAPTLPVHYSKLEFLKALKNASVIIFSSTTGTGKSTQLPQMILDDQLAWRVPCRIYCSCPRKVAARWLATQVGQERGQPLERDPQSVGFATRKERKLPHSLNSILYMTEGTLLRVFDNALCTHVLVDELQERSIVQDLLLARIRRRLQEQPGLKVVLMGATMDTTFFKNYFASFRVAQVVVHDASHAVQDYFLDAVSMHRPWACPSEVISQVVIEFQKLTAFRSVLV